MHLFAASFLVCAFVQQQFCMSLFAASFVVALGCSAVHVTVVPYPHEVTVCARSLYAWRNLQSTWFTCSTPGGSHLTVRDRSNHGWIIRLLFFTLASNRCRCLEKKYSDPPFHGWINRRLVSVLIRWSECCCATTYVQKAIEKAALLLDSCL